MWDIATARVRTGLSATDASNDAQLQIAMDASLALIEKYCDRKFLYKNTIEEFTHVGSTVSLERYPIDYVDNIHDFGEINKINGMLDTGHSRYLKVQYAGGYKVLPADLEMAFWSVFDAVHASTAATGPALSGGIKKLAITGVGSIDYDTGSSASSPTGGAFGGLMPMTALNILDLYRRDLA